MSPMRAEPRLEARRHEREEREDAALAAVVRPHDERQVLHRDDHRERPEDERQDAEEVGLRRRDAVLRIDALLDRVERARSDVAEDDSSGQERELGHARVNAGVGRRRVLDRPHGVRIPGQGHVLFVVLQGVADIITSQYWPKSTITRTVAAAGARGGIRTPEPEVRTRRHVGETKRGA